MGSRPGLIVDFGGVLTTNVFAGFQAFCTAEGLEPEELGNRFRHDTSARDLLVDFECGRLETADFEQRFGALLGVAPDDLVERIMGHLTYDESMVEGVRAARAAGIRTGLLSNSWGDRYDRRLLGELFDGVVISGEEGIRKPDPQIYALAAQRIELRPEECVFVDDLPFNLKPARELGMATVHHTTAEQTLAELQDLLGVALPGAQRPPR